MALKINEGGSAMKCEACGNEILTKEFKCDVCGWPDFKKVIEYFDTDNKRKLLDMRYRLLKYFLDNKWIKFTAELTEDGWVGLPPDGSFVTESNFEAGIGAWWFEDGVGNNVYLLWNTIRRTTAQAMSLGLDIDTQLRGVYTNPYDMFRDIEEIEEENKENRRDASIHWERRLINHPYGASMYGKRVE